MKKIKVTFEGILVFEKGCTIVHFPDGSAHHHPHTAFVRFSPRQLKDPPSGIDCRGDFRWIGIGKRDAVVLEGIKEGEIKYAAEFFGSDGVLELDEICANNPALKTGPHPTLRLTGGLLTIGHTTTGEWEFRPNRNGAANSKGIKRKLVNRVWLTATLGDDEARLGRSDGQAIVFKPMGDGLELTFGNLVNPCPVVYTPEASAPAQEAVDDHFEIYYNLITHGCGEDHLPWGPALKPTSEEGGGCPPLVKRP